MRYAEFMKIVRLRINTDGNGARSAIFVHGCPLDCVWCCNPETRVGKCEKRLDIHGLYEYIRKDIPYFLGSEGGVTFSGGEPLLYAEYIRTFADTYCHDFGVNIETSLYAPWNKIELLQPVIDEWFIDFKVFDEKKHIEFTGKSNAVIKENLEKLSEHIPKEKIIVTFPMIPTLNITDENIIAMMEYLDNLGLYNIELHPYRKNSEDKHIKAGLEPIILPEVSKELYDAVKTNFEGNGFKIVNRDRIVGKDKCKYLKKIRREYCEKHGLDVEIIDCPVTEPCIGTCPQCEYELDMIDKKMKENTKKKEDPQ
ncbi:MAG: radical SAM protein [Ruminococcaceae bacterium]|nr:radical SAM protein [Oscillospiraceae bacterium]